MEVLGRRERPRLLVIGVDEASEFGRHLTKLAPTTRFLPQNAHLGLLRQRDWDAAVLWDTDARLEPHLFVIQFGGTEADGFELSEADVVISRRSQTVATQFKIPDDLPLSIASLTRSELAPIVLNSSTTQTIDLLLRSYKGSPPSNLDVKSILRPFLLDADDRPVAGRYQRGGEISEWWIIPETVANPERWVAAALEEWRSIAPESFPGDAAWSTRPEWATSEELVVWQDVESLEADWRAAVTAHDEAASNLEVRRQEAQQRSDENERRLLTSQGEDLVEEVVTTLTAIGFTVQDVDREVTVPGDRREDIRVTDPDVPDWIAIGEVRGYGRGAQLNDLLRLGRFVVRFARDVGKEPEAVWYVVNHFRELDPSSRPAPLEGNKEEVATFADGGGVVIDTRDLFRLRSRVNLGQLSADGARRILREARGRLDLK